MLKYSIEMIILSENLKMDERMLNRDFDAFGPWKYFRRIFMVSRPQSPAITILIA